MGKEGYFPPRQQLPPCAERTPGALIERGRVVEARKKRGDRESPGAHEMGVEDIQHVHDVYIYLLILCNFCSTPCRARGYAYGHEGFVACVASA